MSANWRDKAKKRFKKPNEGFFDFAEEETTFNANEDLASRKLTEKTNGSKVTSKPKVDPVENPYKTRVKPVQATRVNPVEDPYKTRVSENASEVETRIPTRVSKIEDPYKTRVNPVQKIKSVQTLSGKQKSAFLFLILDAKENGSSIESGDRITSQICSAALAEAATTKGYEATRAVANALKKSGLLERYQTKDGPGGWTIYRISKSTYLEGLNCLSRIKPVEDPYKTRVKPVHQPVYKPVQTDPSSSSSLISSSKEKELTTTGNSLSGEWTSIQTPDELRVLGFGANQVRQICEAKILTPEQLQTSLDHFAYDLSQGLKPKTNPLNYIMGILIKRAVPYVSSSYLQTEQKEIADYVALVEQTKSAREALVQQQKEIQFEEWFASLNQEKRANLVPPNNIASLGSSHHKMMLKQYFLEEVWNDDRGLAEEIKDQIGREPSLDI